MLRTIFAAAGAFFVSSGVVAEPFDGARVGVHAGWDHPRFEAAAFSTGGSVTSLGHYGFSGIAYGLEAGYDIALGSRWVIGAEATADLSTADLGSTVTYTSGGQTYTANSSFKEQLDLGVILRAGVRLDERTLLFAGGGYSRARTHAVSTVTPAIPGAGVDAHATREGWRVAAGLERAIGDRLYGSIQYRHSDYGEAGLDNSRHQIFAGVGLRF